MEATDWETLKIQKLLLWIDKSPSAKREMGTSAPVCDPNVFKFRGRENLFLTVLNKLFNNRNNNKVRHVICTIATMGFGKSAFCDAFCEYCAQFFKDRPDRKDVVVPVAISFKLFLVRPAIILTKSLLSWVGSFPHIS